MALSIDWPTKVINVPKADMLLIQSVPSEIRQLDIDAFRLELKSIEADEGMPFLDTHSHNTTVTVGGVTLARVVEIINGYTVTFEDGQYAVNLVGANSNIADVTNVNQVSVRSANSAGLTYSDAINKQSFQGGFVYINPTNGLPGTQFPRGTPSDPVSNYTDGKVIADNNNYNDFRLDGKLTIPLGADLEGQTWLGEGPVHSELVLDNNAVSGLDLENIGVRGVVTSGDVFFKDCLLTSKFEGFEGTLDNCQLSCDVVINSGATGQIFFNKCTSHVAGTGSPGLDLNNSLANANVALYAGELTIKNVTQGNMLNIDIVAGNVIIDSSCTSGEIKIRGNCKVTDNSLGVSVDQEYVINTQVEEVDKMTKLIPATL